jgi:hypothetical protein
MPDSFPAFVTPAVRLFDVLRRATLRTSDVNPQVFELRVKESTDESAA